MLAGSNYPRRGMARKKKEESGLVDQLKAAIRASGQNLQDLGQASGVGKDILSRFMRGERGLTLVTAEKLVRALGYDLVKRQQPGEPEQGEHN